LFAVVTRKQQACRNDNFFPPTFGAFALGQVKPSLVFFSHAILPTPERKMQGASYPVLPTLVLGKISAEHCCPISQFI
jgi:hypothetical protein